MSGSQKSYAAAAATHSQQKEVKSDPPIQFSPQPTAATHPTHPPIVTHNLSPTAQTRILRSPPVVANSNPDMSEKVAPVPMPSFASPAKHEYLRSLDPNIFDDSPQKSKLLFGDDAVPKSTAKAPLPTEAAAIMTSSAAARDNSSAEMRDNQSFGMDANERKMEESSDILSKSTDELRQILETERKKHSTKAVAYESLKRNYYIKTNELQKKITKLSEKLKLLQKSTHSDAFEKLVKEKHELRRALTYERAARMTDRQHIWKAFSENMDLWRRIQRTQMEINAWQRFYADNPQTAYQKPDKTHTSPRRSHTPISRENQDSTNVPSINATPSTPVKTPSRHRRVHATPARASELKVPDLGRLTHDYSPADLGLIKKLIAENKTLCKNVNQLRYLLDDERKRRKRQEEIVQKTNIDAAKLLAKAAVNTIGKELPESKEEETTVKE